LRSVLTAARLETGPPPAQAGTVTCGSEQAETRRMVAERIAYHEAKAKEEEEERAKRSA
jgi:hypothetical protein